MEPVTFFALTNCERLLAVGGYRPDCAITSIIKFQVRVCPPSEMARRMASCWVFVSRSVLSFATLLTAPDRLVIGVPPVRFTKFAPIVFALAELTSLDVL